MTEITSEEYLKQIGDRPLTEEEAKKLHLLKIKEGKASGASALLDALEEELKE